MSFNGPEGCNRKASTRDIWALSSGQPHSSNDGSLSFLLRFAREVERAHGIETPNAKLT